MFPSIKNPSAWLPIALSLIVVVAWCISFATAGAPARQPDEGTGAHLFQIWLAAEVLMVVFFTIKWLPQNPKQALKILVLQIAVALLACAPVFYLKL